MTVESHGKSFDTTLYVAQIQPTSTEVMEEATESSSEAAEETTQTTEKKIDSDCMRKGSYLDLGMSLFFVWWLKNHFNHRNNY